MQEKYDTAVIRELIKEAYSDLDFTEMCFDNFHDARALFSGGMLLPSKIQALMEYVENRGRLEELLGIICQQRPEKYNQYRPRLVKLGWILSRQAATGEQRNNTVVAEQTQPMQSRLVEPSPSPPLAIRFNVDEIRRQVDALKKYLDLYSQAEDILRPVPSLQTIIESQRTICTGPDSRWEDVRRGHDGLAQTCDDLSHGVRGLTRKLNAMGGELPPPIAESVERLKKAQSEVDSFKEQLGVECDEITRIADASLGTADLQGRRMQITNRLTSLRREVGNLKSAVAAARDEIYDEIRERVTQLARLVLTE